MKVTLLDSLYNLVSGIGTSRDKRMASQYQATMLSRQQVEEAYRSDWIARKVVDIPAQDSVRNWRAWHAEDDQIEAVEGEEKRLDIVNKVGRALTRARLYGGGGLVMGLGDDPTKPLNVEAVPKGGLKYVHVVSRYDITSQDIDYDVTSEFYGQPKQYMVTPVGRAPVSIHPSRVIRFMGNELPSVGLSSDGWGDSVLQVLDSAIKNAGLSIDGIAGLIQEAKVDVVRIPNFMANVGTEEYRARIIERMSLANISKSTVNSLLLDKDEEWERIATDFGTLDQLLHLYLQIAAGASDIPATRFLGVAAKGLNATGEGDARNYYDRIKSDQQTKIAPQLNRLDEVMIRSALGEWDPNIYYEWTSLWSMDEVQRSTMILNKANAFKVDHEAALMPPEVLRKARENQLVEDGVYPGLEAAIEEFGDLPVPEANPQVQAQFQASRGVSLPPVEPPPAQGVPPSGRAASNTAAQDSTPRTLYVRRDVVNAKDILDWARAQGFKTTVPADKLHVTVAFSRTPLDWVKVGEAGCWGQDDKGQLTVAPGGPRLVERLGPRQEAIVLMFASSALSWRHEDIKRCGASWDFDDYQPHVTVSWDAADLDLKAVEPYRGPIVLGPEVFEEVAENWQASLREEPSQ